MIRVDQVL